MAKNEKAVKKPGKIAGIIAELKQVSWPKFSDVMKKLGSVLIITGMFLVVLMGIDALLKWMYSALIMGVVGKWNTSGGYFYIPVGTDETAVTQTMGTGVMLAAAIVAGVLVVAAVVAVVIVKGRKKEDY